MGPVGGVAAFVAGLAETLKPVYGVLNMPQPKGVKGGLPKEAVMGVASSVPWSVDDQDRLGVRPKPSSFGKRPKKDKIGCKHMSPT